MASRMSLTVRDLGVQLRLGRASGSVRDELRAEMREQAEALRTASLAAVPRRDSILANSAFAKTADSRDEITGTVGYSAPYAAAIHENPRAGKTGGVSPSGRRYKKWAKVGGFKYLERPLAEMRADFVAGIRDAVRRVFS